MRPPCRVQVFRQPARRVRPPSTVPWTDRVQLQGPALERSDPVRPLAEGAVTREHIETATFLVDRDQSLAGFTADLHPESRHAPEGTLVEIPKDSFDQGMAGGEEVEQIVLDRRFPIERADERGSA